MLKNIAWDTKEKKIAAVIFTLIVCGQLFFETMRVGFNDIWQISIIAVAGIVYSLFFITSIEGKWNRLFSAQGIIAALTIVASLGLAESHEVSNATIEGVYSMLAVSVMMLMAQKIYLLPVAAIIGFVASLFVKQPLIQSTVLFAIPATIGLSFVHYSSEFKKPSVWKIIIFVLSQNIMLGAFGYTVFCRIYTITFHSFITQIWDSAASLIAISVLIFLAVATIIKKRNVLQIFGYLLAALLSAVPMFMETKYVLISAMSLFMLLLFASKEGSVADEIFGDIVYLLNPKNKGKTKAKPKKKK